MNTFSKIAYTGAALLATATGGMFIGKYKAAQALEPKEQQGELASYKLQNIIETDSFFRTADADRTECLGGDTLHLKAIHPTQVKCEDKRILTYLPQDGTKIIEDTLGRVEEFKMNQLPRIIKSAINNK